ETRVVIDLKSEADFSYFTLSSPSRLVVDLKHTNLATKLPVVVKDSPVLSKIRKSSPPDKNTYRLVFELKKSSTAELFKLSPTPGGQYGHRLVIDLPHGAASKGTTTSKPSKPTVSKNINQVKRQKDILIVIDPGHGGEDPGSIGPSRKYEKNATLSISRKLAAQLNAVPGIKTRMTRNADYFVNLNRRVAIARENEAHLFISIHADAFTTPQPRGGSVFVLNTRRANTEISRWIENKEKQSELLGGSGAAFTGNIDDKNVNQTLLDLQFSHSQKEGYKLATTILSEMGKVAKLHNSKPINTSLAVLRSPQIPSVLVETGFISNPTEEKLLFQRSHQDKLARAVTKAVVKYLKANPPEGIILSNAT
ncbi:N-acetylmuramoyl-L-alanine amidase, partial [Vibrio splendidus]